MTSYRALSDKAQQLPLNLPQAAAGAALGVSLDAKREGLGIYAKSTSPPELSGEEKRRVIRADRYRHLAVARDLFIAEGRQAGLAHPHDYYATAKCIHIRRGGAVSVHHSTEHQSAFFSGLVTCGSVWACPVCAAKVQERRREELARAIDWAWQSGLQPMMVTLTAPHSRAQSLAELRDMQAKALTLLRSGKGGQRLREALGHEGLIRALEVTYGANGWHLHTHELWIVGHDADPVEAQAMILERWRGACAKAGLLDLANAVQVKAFDRHSVDVKGRCSASDYLAKMDDSKHWGIDREMAKASSKAGKKSGMHPFGLLAEAAEGDQRAGSLFVEYAMAMRGKRQLFWSKGLKAKVGVDDVTDEELAERADDKAVVLGQLQPPEWDLVVRAGARARVLDAAELGGWAAVLALLSSLETPPAGGPTGPSSGSPTPACLPLSDLPLPDPVSSSDKSVVWLAGVAWYADLDTGELHGRAYLDTPSPEPLPI